jgi:hypothetical protein
VVKLMIEQLMYIMLYINDFLKYSNL